MQKRLYKSEDNRILCGVCGGVGEYLGVDPTLVRLVWVLITLAAGAGLLLYIIAAIIMRESLCSRRGDGDEDI